MFRTDNGTASATPPTIPAAGTPGFFARGVPGTSSVVDDWWLTMLQEEPLNVLAAAGVVASKPDFTQLARAIRRLAAANVSTVAASVALTADNLGLVEINASAGPIVITLPPVACMLAGVRASLRLVRIDSASAHGVTVQRAGSDAFMNTVATSFTVPVGMQAIELTGDGAGSWHASIFNVRQVPPAYSRSAQGITPGPGYSGAQSVAFTAPVAGYVFAHGYLNISHQAAAVINTTLSINGSTVSADATEASQAHHGVLAVAAGAVVTTTYTVETGADPVVDCTYSVGAFFVPYP